MHWLRWRLPPLPVAHSWVSTPSPGFFPFPPITSISWSLAHPGSDFIPAAPLVSTQGKLCGCSRASVFCPSASRARHSLPHGVCLQTERCPERDVKAFPTSWTWLIPPRPWPPAAIWEPAARRTVVTAFDQAGHIVRVPPPHGPCV